MQAIILIGNEFVIEIEIEIAMIIFVPDQKHTNTESLSTARYPGDFLNFEPGKWRRRLSILAKYLRNLCKRA